MEITGVARQPCWVTARQVHGDSMDPHALNLVDLGQVVRMAVHEHGDLVAAALVLPGQLQGQLLDTSAGGWKALGASQMRMGTVNRIGLSAG